MADTFAAAPSARPPEVPPSSSRPALAWFSLAGAVVGLVSYVIGWVLFLGWGWIALIAMSSVETPQSEAGEHQTAIFTTQMQALLVMWLAVVQVRLILDVVVLVLSTLRMARRERDLGPALVAGSLVVVGGLIPLMASAATLLAGAIDPLRALAFPLALIALALISLGGPIRLAQLVIAVVHLIALRRHRRAARVLAPDGPSSVGPLP